MLRNALIVLIAGAAGVAAPAADRAPDDAPFAKRLAKLTPGAPQTCINPSRSGGSDHAGNQVLIEDRSGTIFLAHFQGGCEARDSDALISRRPSTQLCRGDVVEIRDLTSGFSRGMCAYSDFTPYRRVK
jgi:hypothetical protein